MQRIPLNQDTPTEDKDFEKLNQVKLVRTLKPAGGGVLGLVDGPKRIARPVVAKQPLSDPTVEVPHPSRVQSDPLSSPAKQENKSPALLPVDELKLFAENSHWESRMLCLENIQARLQNFMGDDTETVVLAPSQLLIFEVIFDLVATFLDDVHHKVASESLATLETCIVKFPDQSVSKLASFLPILFQRLADRRPHIREKANMLLNVVRSSYDPVVIVAALAPKIHDLPDRTKAAVIQFLCVIVPYTSQYFMVPHNTSTLVSKLANILGTVNSKPTVALLTAGTRYLLLYLFFGQNNY
jgi:hypothetical protein